METLKGLQGGHMITWCSPKEGKENGNRHRSVVDVQKRQRRAKSFRYFSQFSVEVSINWKHDQRPTMSQDVYLRAMAHWIHFVDDSSAFDCVVCWLFLLFFAAAAVAASDVHNLCIDNVFEIVPNGKERNGMDKNWTTTLRSKLEVFFWFIKGIAICWELLRVLVMRLLLFLPHRCISLVRSEAQKTEAKSEHFHNDSRQTSSVKS